ncbi:MAG: hypothetical protein LBC75_08750 [Fibromonadaceae bacterium]|jgi:hypothetical protein|nr:hypothetical protein [Fibromonadaceae bacterium]
MNKTKFSLLAAGISLALVLTSCFGKSAVTDSASGSKSKRIADAPEIELENKLTESQRKSIPWGIGTGVSTDRQMARTESIAQAQAATARNSKLIVTGLLDTYAKNVNGEAKRITEDKINNFVDTQIEGSYVFETIMEFNEEDKKYSVYTLVLLDPDRIAEALKAALGNQEEQELRAASEKMQDRLEQMKAEYRGLKK